MIERSGRVEFVLDRADDLAVGEFFREQEFHGHATGGGVVDHLPDLA